MPCPVLSCPLLALVDDTQCEITGPLALLIRKHRGCVHHGRIMGPFSHLRIICRTGCSTTVLVFYKRQMGSRNIRIPAFVVRMHEHMTIISSLSGVAYVRGEPCPWRKPLSPARNRPGYTHGVESPNPNSRFVAGPKLLKRLKL